MADITEYISGSIIEGFDTLDGKPRRESVIAFVEGEDDVSFWKSILSTYAKYNFRVTPNRAYKVNGKFPNGKTALLNISNLKKNRIICIDADLDLIVGNYSTYSRIIRQCPYIVNTQFYSMENVLSQAPLLRTIVNTVTGEDVGYDFDGFLKAFSNAIADLFLLYLASIKGKRSKFSLIDFKSYINSIRTLSKDFKGDFASFQQNYKMQLKDKLNIHRNSMIQYKKRLRSLGYKERDTYKLIQGHTLYNSVIRELLFHLCNNILERKLANLIKSYPNANHQDQKKQVYEFLGNNKLRNYIDIIFEKNESVKYYIPEKIKSSLDCLYLI